MSARSKQVGIILSQNLFYIWEVGGDVIPIQPPQIRIEPSEKVGAWSPEAILFHPLKHGHFFIFYNDWPGAGILVQEFIEWIYYKTQYVFPQNDLSSSS